MAKTPYAEQRYRRLRGMLLGPGVVCAHCKRQQATTLDHDPPLAMHQHREGTGCCRLIPSCRDCNQQGGQLVRMGVWQPDMPVLRVEPDPERPGLAASDPRWRVPWLKGLRRPPRDAVWPRLMTVPHPAASGSYGREFIQWAEHRTG